MHGTPGNRGGAAEHFHNLQTLTDELLEHVLSRCSVMDICRVSKVSRRLRDVTWRSQVIWAEQWSRTYPGLSPPPEDQEVARTDDEHATGMRISSSYMLRAFREQWTRRSRDAAVVRRARRAARASKVQVLEQGVHRLQRAVQAERALLASLHEQLHGLSTSRRAGLLLCLGGGPGSGWACKYMSPSQKGCANRGHGLGRQPDVDVTKDGMPYCSALFHGAQEHAAVQPSGWRPVASPCGSAGLAARHGAGPSAGAQDHASRWQPSHLPPLLAVEHARREARPSVLPVPVQAEEVEASLQQRLRESRLELSKLSNQLGAETRRLRAAHAKLAQLLP